MNICLLSLEWPPYGCGIGTYVFNVARGLAGLGHNVTVITHDKEPLPCSAVKIVQVRVPCDKSTILRRAQKWRTEPYHTWSKRAYKRFSEICDSERFDIIETAEFGAWARYFAGRTDIPLVVRCHNPTYIAWAVNQNGDNLLARPLWLRFQDKYERRQTFGADAIVSPSYSLTNYLSLNWLIPRSRFTVLANPIDSKLFRPGESDNKGNNEILYVGRLEYGKGVFDLVEAVRHLLGKYPEINIRFVGMDCKPPRQFSKYGDKASEVIRSMLPDRYCNRLIFTGHIPVSEIVSYLQGAICVVVPSRGFESFSYTVLEAMSCGTAVVSTYCGGPAEIVTDGVDGLLVPPGDVVGLGAAIQRLIDNKELRQRLGVQGRETVERCFSIPAVVPKIVRFYEETITKCRKER